ncbi:MAG: hypothetical protein A2734_00545 [Parcubacteria group bacterium RIFCSPHIGHO2_01_FULL_40_30]|nr:MAG: hypothetical protein A2734_00545 [Parcubacteria group bacterium RIFCSPHIGHO2_01_FULL_40_30]OHB19102.1 MAG: hypothetical protein A3D40_01205 [Parcubacteria group bacterium RIFCSPHIGHO2_02_FULL_40_12]
MPQASKNLILLTILLAFILSASFVFATPAVSQGPRYFIKTANPFWQKSFGVRHAFENGFTSDLSGIQITLAKIFGIEIEPVEELHVLPEEIIVEIIKNPSAKPGAKGPIRPIPFDQTPWGVEVIYDDSVIASTSGGRGVNVAVLDTGVLKTHVDLKNRVSQCKDFTNLKTPIKDGTCDDKNGHGTHVSGIILADGGDDNLGIYGVAPEANLFVYKVCGNDGSCWADDIAIALRTAADNGANVINMSLGSDNESSFIKNAINYVVSRDVLVVAAGGNDGPYPASIDYPAANPKVLAVGAVNEELLVPDWSSLGINSSTSPFVVEEKDMEFGAPGVKIESTWKNGGYAILSGTSMASPHVAGLAAKFWQEIALEGTRASATRDILHQVSKDIWLVGDDNATGFGLPQINNQ